MKNFILGIIVTLVIGAWIIVAVVGIISLKVAVFAPVVLIAGVFLGIWLFFTNWWN